MHPENPYLRVIPPSIPLLYPAVAILLGTFLGICHPESGVFNTGMAFIAMLVTVILLGLRRYAVSVVIICFAVGWFNAELQTPTAVPMKYQQGNWIFSGKITHIHETETSTVTDVTIDSIGSNTSALEPVKPIRLQLTIAGFGDEADIARRITWRGNLADRHTLQRLPMMDDISQHARRRGITGATVIRPDAIHSVCDEPGLLNALYRYRARIADAIYATSMSPSTTEFLAVVLLGDTDLLTADRRDAYSSAGLSHILALSGMHVAIIAMLISTALFPLLVMRRRMTVIIVTVIVLWIYAAVTGFSPSVTRAVIMATVFSGSRLIQRRSSPYNSLCLAAMLIVLADPFALLSYGFQLSFAAVLSIVAFSRILNFVNPRHRLRYYLAAYITVPVSAMLGTGLLSCYYFHTFPLYFIPAATIATLLLPVICIGGVIATVLSQLHLHGIMYGLTYMITDRAVQLLDHTSTAIASLPHATWDNINISYTTLLFSLVVVICLALWLNLKKRIYGYMSALFLIAAAVCSLTEPPYPYHNVSAIMMPDRSFTTLLIHNNQHLNIYTDAVASDTILVKERVKRDFATHIRHSDVADTRIAANQYQNIKINLPYITSTIFILSKPDTKSLAMAAAASDSLRVYIIISGKATASDIRKAPLEILVGHKTEIMPSTALRPRMASMIYDRCRKLNIPTSDHLVLTVD